MKRKFLKRSAAFLTAAIMAFGIITVVPKEYKDIWGTAVSADDELTLGVEIESDENTGISVHSAYSSFKNVPCGEYCQMSLYNGVLTISGFGPMFNYTYDNAGELYEGLGDYYDWTYYTDYISSCREYINEIIISDSITYIGSYAFIGTNISTVTLPSNLYAIGSSAFANCKNLYEIELPNSLETIGTYAFQNTYLSKIIIPQKTVLDGYGIFEGCGDFSIYGYKGSSAEEYAIDNDIPFVALDGTNSAYSEDDLLNIIKQKSGREIFNHIYIDMDHDEKKEIIAVVAGKNVDTYDSEIWYCSSNGIAIFVTNFTDFLNKYYEFKSISYDTESHVIFNYGSNYVPLSKCIVFTPNNSTINTAINSYGMATVSDKNTIHISYEGYYGEFEPIPAFECDYKYDFIQKKYVEIENGDTYTVTWVNDDGTTIYTERVNKGEHPTYNAEKWGTPVSSTGNKFKGWANIPETEDNIVIPVFSTTDTSYTGIGGDVTYYAIYGDFVNVKWYNGKTLLEEKYCKENTVPAYSEDIPKCYDDEYGLVREFLGWTTADNSNYDITMPDIIKPVTQDTVYYAVFSDKDPTTDVSEKDVYDIDYINQHMESAHNRLWDIASLSSQNKVVFESSPTEFTNGLWSGTEVAVDVINLDIFGLVDKVSANDYNIIMLDMFASVENMELAEKTLNDSILKAVKENTKFLKQVCSLEKLTITDYNNILKDIDYAYNNYLKEVEMNDPNGLYNYCVNIQDVIKKYKLEDIDISEVGNALKPYHAFSEINNIIGDVSTVVGTFKSYSENMVQIISSEAYIYMDDVYKELLVDMYHEAEKYDGNSWEIRNLKNAILYALNYNENYKKTAILSTIHGTSYELAKLIFGTNTLEKPGSLVTESVSDKFRDTFVKYATTFINKTFKSEVTSSTVGIYLKGLQVGSKLGMYISDSVFDTSSRHDMYIKIKEYGVIEDVMKKVLDKKADELLTASSLEAQHTAALKYDKAYKMYFAIEIMGSENIAEYEKSLMPSGIKTAIQKWMGAGLAYEIMYNESIDKAILRHTANYNDYTLYSKSLSNYPCHKDIFINENNYIDIILKYNLHIQKYKIAIISCPVKVNVYDENKMLVGTLSSENTNVNQGYEIYMYRIEETDSNIVCVPTDYTIEIIGLEKGTMNVITGYFENNEQINTVSFNNVPIDSEYRAQLEIDETTSSLTEITASTPSSPTYPSIPTTPSNPAISPKPTESGNVDSTDTTVIIPTSSNTFTVKTENKITDKTGKARAVRKNNDVTVTLGKANNGYYANACTSDGTTLDSVIIENGKAKLTIPKDIEFYIIIDDKSYLKYEDISAGASKLDIYDCVSSTSYGIIIGFIITAALFTAIRKRKKIKD